LLASSEPFCAVGSFCLRTFTSTSNLTPRKNQNLFGLKTTSDRFLTFPIKVWRSDLGWQTHVIVGGRGQGGYDNIMIIYDITHNESYKIM